MKPELPDKDFKELEKICLLLDILIDCEEYEAFDKKLERSNVITLDLDKGNENGPEKIIGEYIDKIIKEELSPPDATDSTKLFSIILNSKYVRKLLKKYEDDLPSREKRNLHKRLTEALLKKIPERQDESETVRLFRIIFLNEISACSESELAIGYADIALKELEEWFGNGRNDKGKEGKKGHPYELYALYNKGLTYLHDQRNADKAIETLEQIKLLFEIPSGDEDSFLDYYKGNENIDELYPIYYWLCYLPSKYLIAEAYSDSSSSFNLEHTVQEALRSMSNGTFSASKIFNDNSHNKLGHKIENYYRIKFYTKLIYSAIDKRDARAFDGKRISRKDSKWLNKFKSIDNVEIDAIKKFINENAEENSLIIHLESAKALLLLECARMFRKESNKNLEASFTICCKHLRKLDSSDWPDFACTFLENTIFSFQIKDYDKSPEDFNYPKDFDYNYKAIFKKLIDKEWIARKKDLVEKFLECQEKLLQQFETKKDNGENVRIVRKECNTYIRYQTELVNNILSKDSERLFKKRWSDSQKEKLGKTLIITVHNIYDNKDLSRWWEEAKGDFKKNKYFDEIIETLNTNLADDKYSLPKNVSSVEKFVHKHMNCDYYTKKLRMNTEEFYDHLIYQSSRPMLTNCYVLTVLRRWQSFTPALSMGSEVGHKGGGYFVYKTNHKGEIEEGLVVDPGYDFLDNFFDEGFSIRDISGILITHSHSDHANDFMAIVNLLHEMNQNGKRVFKDGKWKERKLILFIAEGCHQNFAMRIMGNRDKFHDVIRVTQRTRPYGGKNHFLKDFQLEVTKANHEDQSDHDSVGYIIKDKEGKELIGFTGDTRWYNNIESKYKGCPVICMNIGGVVDIFKKPELKLSDLCNKDDRKRNIKNIKKILLRENHLYLPGFYLMAEKLSKQEQKLLILSELCEEMKGGLRTDLSEKFSQDQKLEIPVLPEDIGLTVILSGQGTGDVLCSVCKYLHDPKNIIPVETDKDNAIVYLCKEHYNQLKEESILPKINELELDINELRKPLIKQDGPFPNQAVRKRLR